MGAVGTVLQVGGQTTQAIGSKAMAEQNADLTRIKRYLTYINSDLIDISNKYNQKELEAQKKKVVSSQRATIGRSGVTFDGSVAEIALDTLYNFEKEKINMDIQANMEKMQLKIERKMLEITEKQQRQAGTLNLISGLMGAGGSAMSGASK